MVLNAMKIQTFIYLESMRSEMHAPDDELKWVAMKPNHQWYSHEKLLTEKLPTHTHHLFALAQFNFSFCFGLHLVIELFGSQASYLYHIKSIPVRVLGSFSLSGSKSCAQITIAIFEASRCRANANFATPSMQNRPGITVEKHLQFRFWVNFIRFVNVEVTFFLSLSLLMLNGSFPFKFQTKVQL